MDGSFYILDDNQPAAPDGVGDFQDTLCNPFPAAPALRGLKSRLARLHLARKPTNCTISGISGFEGFRWWRSFEGSADAERSVRRRRGRWRDEESPRGPAVHAQPTRRPAQSLHWDRLIPGATSFEGRHVWRAERPGSLAVPVRYQVRLVVNVVIQDRALLIQRDPRADQLLPGPIWRNNSIGPMQARDKTINHQMVIRIPRDPESVNLKKCKTTAILQPAGERLTRTWW